MRQRLSFLLGLVLFLAVMVSGDRPAAAGVAGSLTGKSITAVGTTEDVQNFDALLTTATPRAWVDHTSLPGWYVRSVPSSTVTLQGGNGSSATAGLYAFEDAVGRPTDGGFGAITSSADYYLAYVLTNNTTSTIDQFDLRHVGEHWRVTGANITVEFSWNVAASFTSADITGSGTRETDLDFTTTTTASEPYGNQGNSLQFFKPGPFQAGPQLFKRLATVSIPPGWSILLRWKFPQTANGPGVALDDVVYKANTSTLGTSTALTVTPADGQPYGTTYTLSSKTMTTSGNAGTGQVTFTVGGVPTGGSVPVNASGEASTSVLLNAGSRVVGASFTDSSGAFGASSAPTVTRSVAKAIPDFTVTSTAANAFYGASRTFTATPKNPVMGSTAPAPTGSYTWNVDASCTTGTCTTTRTPAGAPVSVSFTFTPDAASAANYVGASSGTTVAVSPATVAVAISTTSTTPAPGASVTLTASAINISNPGGGVLPSGGEVKFYRANTDGTGKTQVGATQTLVLGGASVTVNGRDLGYGPSNVFVEVSPTDPNYQTALRASGSTLHTVNVGTSVAVTGAATSRYGTQITALATVTSADAPFDSVTNGTVTFTLAPGSVAPVMANVLADGTAPVTFNVPTLDVGAYTISATYTRAPTDTYHNTSTSTGLQILGHTRLPAVTTITPAFATTQEYGEDLVLKATLNSATAGSPPDCAACVTFVDTTASPGTPLGSGALVGGIATLTLVSPPPALTVGPHKISATYVQAPAPKNYDDASFTDAPLTIDKAISTVTATMTTPAAALFYGAPFSFDVKVMGNKGSTPLSGTVVIKTGAFTSAPLTLTTGRVTVTETLFPEILAAGATAISVDYSGDGNHKPGNGALAFTILRASVTVSISSSPNPSVNGQTVLVTGSMLPQFRGVPTGSLTFLAGGVALGSVGASGTGSFSTSALAVGSNALLASYSGDSNFLPTTGAGTHVVSKGTTTTALLPSSNPVVPGTPVTFGISVATSGAATGEPTGIVTVLDNGATVGTASLAGGYAVVTSNGFTAGAHSITAQYDGDTQFSGSVSDPVVVTATTSATSFALTATPGSPLFGQQVTILAQLSSTAGTPTGTVTIKDGATVLGALPISGGTVTLTTSSLSPGTHVITAEYPGDGTRLAGKASTAVIVKPRPTTVTLAQSAAESAPGDSVSFTANVASDAGPVPDGLVIFMDGGVALSGPVQVSNGSATFSTTLPLGSHAITAAYQGTKGYSASTSPSLAHVVTEKPDPNAGPTATPPPAPPPPSNTGSGGSSGGAAGAPGPGVGGGNINLGSSSSGDDGSCNATGRPLTPGSALLGALVALYLLTSRRRAR